ncbi:hypothetical protein, partial [Acinetobacter lactucae]|uniref:hypothetical protein n=1 Tax=Acinetobacter lactucae TaxID=1785128 RepID=UPI001C2EDE86
IIYANERKRVAISDKIILIIYVMKRERENYYDKFISFWSEFFSHFQNIFIDLRYINVYFVLSKYMGLSLKVKCSKCINNTDTEMIKN